MLYFFVTVAVYEKEGREKDPEVKRRKGKKWKKTGKGIKIPCPNKPGHLLLCNPYRDYNTTIMNYFKYIHKEMFQEFLNILKNFRKKIDIKFNQQKLETLDSYIMLLFFF